MDKSKILGGCMCGRVRYQFSSPPSSSTICHCNDCRRASGSHSVAWLGVPIKNFSIAKGSPKSFQFSPHATRTFCGDCGTTLTYKTSNRSNEIDVTTGSLDDPERFPPNNQVFEEHKLSWVKD